MSGTSLDGLDLAFCKFQMAENQWHYEILEAQTIQYSTDWVKKLKSACLLPADKFCELDSELAALFANYINEFILKHGRPDFISSHGHTVFHQPRSKITSNNIQPYTSQIASGAIISALTGVSVVCDFRATDVALGGQGAPLVPIGDLYLFDKYDFCLNLGGIANISFNSPVNQTNKAASMRIASDICFANMALNYLAGLSGVSFDKNGDMANSGMLNPQLLDKLNHLDFNHFPFPKSIGVEYFNLEVLPLLESYQIPVEDKLRTFCHHIALQVKAVIDDETKAMDASSIEKLSILLTGGGTYNTFLVKIIKEHLKLNVVIPENKIIDFKEALIFAFLGVLRMRGEVNILKSVTGASRDSCSGAVYLP